MSTVIMIHAKVTAVHIVNTSATAVYVQGM